MRRKVNDIRGMAQWEVPLIFPFEVTRSWISIIEQKISCSIHNHIWEIHTWKHLTVSELERTEKEERRRAEMEIQRQESQNSLQILGEGKNKLALSILCSAEHSCLSDQHMLLAEPSDPGRKGNTEVQQLWSSSHHCQEENKAMNLGHLPFNPPRTSSEVQKKL